MTKSGKISYDAFFCPFGWTSSDGKVRAIALEGEGMLRF